MSNFLKSLFRFISSRSKDTHLWSIGVICGALLLTISFFIDPFDRNMLDGKVVNAKERTIIVQTPQVGYGAILPMLSTGVSSDAVSNTVGVATDDAVTLDDGSAVSAEEFEALCKIVCAEAKSEDIMGQILVANVVLNRVASDHYPDTVIDVITSPGQFEPVSRGAYSVAEPDNTTKEAVMRALNGEDYSNGALYFQKSTATEWGDKVYLFRYGSHSFYK